MMRAILKKIDGLFPVDDPLIETFNGLCVDPVVLEPGTRIAEQGGAYANIFLIENGWVLRSREMENGTRQVVNVVIPGDFAALNAMLFDKAEFELRCKTEVTAFQFEAHALYEHLSAHPRLASTLIWINAHEEAMLAEKIVSLGRRSARRRTAHVLCEFIARLEIIGIEEIEQFAIPLSQEDFADILGMSLPHMNNILRALETDNVVSFRNGLLMIIDQKKLEMEAGFDSGYLHFTRRDDGRGSIQRSPH